MFQHAESVFDPETLTILKAAFDEACGFLPADQRTSEMRSAVAERILNLASRGERDPVRLRTFALMEVDFGRRLKNLA
jgi:hypothetical protein